MANTTISPNMNMPVPTVGIDPGPDWANNIDACLSIVDSHNHTPGQGVAITPAAININTDLPMNGNNLITARTLRFDPQTLAPALPADLGCLFERGVDLYYIDGSGNVIRLTQSGAPAGATGTITGLPSGTASASFAGTTFTFQSATNTPANMNFGPVTIGNNTLGSFGITISPAISIGANYNITLPGQAPATGQQTLMMDSSGNIVLAQNQNGVGMVPIGAVVATFNGITGAYTTSSTTTGDNNTGYVQCVGQTLSDGRSPMDGQVLPDLTSSIFLQGFSSSGATGGANITNLQHQHDMNNHTHNMAHVHQALYDDGVVGSTGLWGITAVDPSVTTFTNTGVEAAFNVANTRGGLAGTTASINVTTSHFYTGGVIDAPAGSDGSNAQTSAPLPTDLTNGIIPGGSDISTTYENRPSYINVRYLMRVY